MRVMKNDGFYAVILSGGSGERFWPLSTPARPKQFLKIFGGRSLLRQAVDRLAGVVPPERVLVVTSGALVAATRRELPDVPRENVIGEPCRRDTAAAVAVACGLVAARGGDNAVAAILTADQLMCDVPAFRRVLSDAARVARKTDDIVTMGVAPDHPATGFGYIQLGDEAKTGVKTPFARAVRFVEKPDLATARRYLASGRYVWNAGMFVWRVATMKAALATCVPALAILAAAVADARTARGVKNVLSTYYPQLPRISIDYAVMEKVTNILVSRSAFGWDDVGTWSGAGRHFDGDAAGNAVKGDVTLLDVKDSVVVSTGRKVAVFGVSGLVVVETPNGLLVADKSRVQDLKKLVAQLETNG